MLLSSLLLIPNIAHAVTGQVSVNGGTQIVIPGSQTTVSVPIQISGSDSLNGFDVQVLADPTILSGTSISLTGSLLGTNPTIVIECINGILIAGSTCAPQDGAGVVHLAAAQVGFKTTAPTSGLLFTINYNVVGLSAGTPISFNTGCSGTSVSGDCVLIANAGVALAETDLGATFANLNDFKMTPAFAKISAPTGVAITDKISYVALGAFSDSLTETVTGPCTLASRTVDLTLPTGSDTLSCVSATTGDFSATVTTTGVFSGTSHSKTISVHVGAAGFSTALNQASVSVAAGTSDSSTVLTVTGVSGFSGSVAVTATGGPTGITGTASPVTLTPDGSGYSTATSTITVSVGATAASGTFTLSVTGGQSLKVVVPSRDFNINPPDSVQSVPRGGSSVVTFTITSTGSFAGTVTLSAAVVANGLDPGTGVNNIVTAFNPSSVTLTPGSSALVDYTAATVKIGDTPNAGNTATGNYTATITASSGTLTPHIATVEFNVFDFSFGPSFCAGSNLVTTSPAAFFDPVSIGEQCNSWTLTNQTVAQGGSQSTLWLQVNPLGGIQTHGVAQTGTVAAVNPFGPGRGTRVPQLHRNVCFFQVFLPDGTQMSRSAIVANGPIVRAGPFSGCRFSFAYALPNDVDTHCPGGIVNATCSANNNIDFLAITADALSNTAPGTYNIRVCGLIGTLLNCVMIPLIVIIPTVVHQFVFSHRVSIGAGGVQSFKLGVTNQDSHTVWAQVTITATDQTGATFPSLATSVFQINPNANANNIALSVTFTKADIGKTITFTTSTLVSAVDPGAVAVDNVNGTVSAGTSTLQSVTATFTITA